MRIIMSAEESASRSSMDLENRCAKRGGEHLGPSQPGAYGLMVWVSWYKSCGFEVRGKRT